MLLLPLTSLPSDELLFPPSPHTRQWWWWTYCDGGWNSREGGAVSLEGGWKRYSSDALSVSLSLSPSVLEIPDQSLGQRRWRPRIPFGLAVLGAGLWQAGLSLRSVFSVNLSTKASDSTAGETSRDASKTASSRLSAPHPQLTTHDAPVHASTQTQNTALSFYGTSHFVVQLLCFDMFGTP